jgi:nitroreductase
MTIKGIIKKLLVKLGLLEIVKFRYRVLLYKKLFRDEFSFNSGLLKNAAAIEASLRLTIHAFEKKFVIENLTTLKNNKLLTVFISKMDTLMEMGYGGENNIIIECLSIINCFIELCKKHSIDCTDIKNQAVSFIMKYKLNKQITDYTAIEIINGKTVPLNNFTDNYKEFVKSRVSIRKTKPGLVDKNIIHEIINLSNLCPSACNRQPCKVYYSVNADTQRQLKNLCGDKMVSSNLSNFIVPTVDKTVFRPREFFQAWLNGGIFINSLVNAFHAYGLGACLFQTTKSSPNVPKIKKLLRIPENEDILCIVGFGEYTEDFNYIKKHRKPTDLIAIER